MKLHAVLLTGLFFSLACSGLTDKLSGDEDPPPPPPEEKLVEPEPEPEPVLEEKVTYLHKDLAIDIEINAARESGIQQYANRKARQEAHDAGYDGVKDVKVTQKKCNTEVCRARVTATAWKKKVEMVEVTPTEGGTDDADE